MKNIDWKKVSLIVLPALAVGFTIGQFVDVPFLSKYKKNKLAKKKSTDKPSVKKA